jgi:hypothetical protein
MKLVLWLVFEPLVYVSKGLGGGGGWPSGCDSVHRNQVVWFSNVKIKMGLPTNYVTDCVIYRVAVA